MLFKAKDYQEVSLDLLEALDCSRSLALAIAVRHNALAENPELMSTYSHRLYNTPHNYLLSAQSCAIFKKRLWLMPEEVPNKDLSESALEAFLKVEHECSEANYHLRARSNFATNGLLHRAATIAQSILGNLPHDTFSHLDPLFTSGSTATLSGLNANIESKILSRLSVSQHAACYILDATRSCGLLKDIWEDNLEYVNYNVFRTVPKSFDKERIVCPEPLGNMLLQRHIARLIKKRLRKVGIDISSQADIHRSILESNSDLVATIDQSDASDRISYELVRQILPPDWFYILNQLRSKNCLLPDGTLHPLQKFMTQGNGFTFELETLIFYCIVKANLDNNKSDDKHFVSIFGDDTLVYDWHSETTIKALKQCFLKINVQKSFSNDTFKESCGTDIMENQNVRPIYFKEFSEGLFGLYELANRIYEVAGLFSNNVYRCRKFLRAYRRVVSRIPIDKRFYGPNSLGDSVLTDDLGENWITVSKHGGCKIKYLKSRPHKIGLWKRDIGTSGASDRIVNHSGQIVYALLGYSSQGTLIRGAPRRVSHGWCNVIERRTGLGWL